MFFKRYGNLVLGLFFMVLAGGFFCLADALPASKVVKIGPAFVPKLVAGLTFVIALVLAITSYQKLRKITPGAAGEASQKDQKEYGWVSLTICAFGAYVMLFEILGFPLATFFYLLVQMPIMAPREKCNIPLFIGVALLTSGGVYYIFKFWLDVMLPAGWLG